MFEVNYLLSSRACQFKEGRHCYPVALARSERVGRDLDICCGPS